MPKNLVGERTDKLMPFKYDISYEGSLELTIECIWEALISLRDKKIEFWTTPFERYKKDKEGIDLELRKKESLYKKDLDRTSKATIEDFKDLF